MIFVGKLLVFGSLIFLFHDSLRTIIRVRYRKTDLLKKKESLKDVLKQKKTFSFQTNDDICKIVRKLEQISKKKLKKQGLGNKS